MSGRTATRIGVLLAVLEAVGFAVFVASGESSGFASAITAFIALMAYSIVGTLVVGRQPGNALAWIFCVAPFMVALSGVSEAYFEHGAAGWPAKTFVGLVADTSWIVAIGMPAAYLGLLIPDGHLPSRRWRPVAWVAAIVLASAVVGTAFGESRVDDRIPNPVQIPGVEYLFPVAAVALLPVLAAGVAAAVVRYHRGTRVERQQLRWIIAAFVVMCCLGVVSDTIPEEIWFGSWALLPIAFSIAIFRYRLYEIDVIIRKTLVYATLVGSLVAVYLGGIYVIGRVLDAVAGQSGALAVTLSTLAVAAAFQPLRTRIQRAVDHRFYRGKYDAEKTLERFTTRLRDQVELDALSADVLDIVTLTLQPRSVSLWLRPTEGQGS